MATSSTSSPLRWDLKWKTRHRSVKHHVYFVYGTLCPCSTGPDRRQGRLENTNSESDNNKKPTKKFCFFVLVLFWFLQSFDVFFVFLFPHSEVFVVRCSDSYYLYVRLEVSHFTVDELLRTRLRADKIVV